MCSKKFFCFMQFIRLLMSITLFGFCLAYFFIFLKLSFVTVNFWTILFTFLAISMLFIGSGKQKVYQMLIDNDDGSGNKLFDKPQILIDNQKQKVKLWWYGLFFYNLAIPFVCAN